LPDGSFANQKYQFGYICEWKVVVYFMYVSYYKARWCIFCPFGIFCLSLGIFLQILVCYAEKMWQPCQKISRLRSLLEEETVVVVAAAAAEYKTSDLANKQNWSKNFLQSDAAIQN
jgi:hypothetical protein